MHWQPKRDAAASAPLPNDALLRLSTPMVALAWTLWLSYEASIGYNRHYSVAPLCPYSTNDLFGRPAWYMAINYTSVGAMVMICLSVIIKISTMESSKAKAILVVTFNMICIGTVTRFLEVFFEWGGVCRDSMGMAWDASVWGEWWSAGPLLIFITVTIVDKPALNRMDWLMMLALFFAMVGGFLQIAFAGSPFGRVILFMAFLTFSPVMYLPFYDIGEPARKALQAQGEGDVAAIELRDLTLLAYCVSKQRDLSLWLSFVLPLFVLAYVLACHGYLDELQLIATLRILSTSTKGLFAAVALDLHADVIVRAEIIEEQRANEARRAFMKYLFHEVRTPLNSLTMGVDMLKMSDTLEPVDQEYLTIMSGATDFMSDTLNNVLSMQKIEEGKLELEKAPFSIVESATKVLAALHGMLAAKQIRLVKHFAANVPPTLVGDRYRIEHVISNFVSNACKFSPNGGEVVVSVTSQPAGGAFADVTVTVSDQGCGISPENQAKLFRNFVQIRPSMLQKGQGSGLGLALCKAIVDLHPGGALGVRSDESRGSAFYFTIRFPVEAGRSGGGGGGGGGSSGGGGVVYAPNTATATTASLLQAAPSGYGTTR